MKKTVLSMVAVLLAFPVVAQEAAPQQQPQDRSAMMQGHGERGHEAFTKAHKEQMAKMKAKQDKMGKLVKEYKGLEDGKKKDAKRKEIEKEVTAIHEEQLKFKKDQLGKFEDRLGEMKKEFSKENSSDGKKEWINKKTDELIKNDGDVRRLFAPQGPRMENDRNGKGPHKGIGKGMHRGSHMGGFKGGQRPQRPEQGQPGQDDLTVQRPVAK